jgi:hypothetical protein
MLSEGWDVKNVFQIVPHEERAFNSKLLIAQVLGRGLARIQALHTDPASRQAGGDSRERRPGNQGGEGTAHPRSAGGWIPGKRSAGARLAGR